MKFFIISFAIVFSIIYQANGCDHPQECDLPPTMIEVVKIEIERALGKYPNDYCKAAQYVKTKLEMFNNENGWVVFIGKSTVITNRMEFGVKAQRIVGTSYRYSDYMNDYSFEVFAVPRNTLPIVDLSFKRIDKEISPWIIVNEISDMPEISDYYWRLMNFRIAANKALNSTDDCSVAANNFNNNIVNKVCSGNWVFIVTTKGNLNNKVFCLKYNEIGAGSFFKAEYKRSSSSVVSHEVMAFASK